MYATPCPRTPPLVQGRRPHSINGSAGSIEQSRQVLLIRQQKERLGGCSGVESLTVRLPVSLVDLGITAEALSTLKLGS